jgi:hypothetical protein
MEVSYQVRVSTALSPRKEPPYSFYRRLDMPQRKFMQNVEEQTPCPYLGIEPWFFIP